MGEVYRAKDTRLDRVVALKILPAHLATNPERRQRFDGPLTVPQIAQMRPTSRQRMQRLADELAAEGLVEFIDNPGHRRSKLLSLTPRGESRYRVLSAPVPGDRLDDGRRFERGGHPQHHGNRAATQR